MKTKKQKAKKKCVIKRKIKFRYYKNCWEENQNDTKINHLQEKEINIYSLKKDYKEFIKNHKLKLKRQRIFKNGRHNTFI